MCKFGSDPDCMFPCHCYNNQICDEDTGDCGADGCDRPIYADPYSGYMGEGCQAGK